MNIDFHAYSITKIFRENIDYLGIKHIKLYAENAIKLIK